MKYFAQQQRIWPPTDPKDEYQVFEITSKYALELYKGLSKPGQYNLVAVPNYNKGKLVKGKAFNVWGENTTNAECFNRRLKGELAQKILNKRIADE